MRYEDTEVKEFENEIDGGSQLTVAVRFPTFDTLTFLGTVGGSEFYI